MFSILVAMVAIFMLQAINDALSSSQKNPKFMLLGSWGIKKVELIDFLNRPCTR